MIDTLQIRKSCQEALFHDGRLVVWFSCGAASACALKLVAHMKPIAVYCDTSRNEHPDNARFKSDVERWTGIPVTVISSEKYKTCEDVWEYRHYMSGKEGAPCTVELKKVPRFHFQNADDTHVFGFTTNERDRVADFENDNCDMNLAWPLIQAGMSHADCLKMISDAGIVLPTMYRLGFNNNNCIGCVKASGARYWNRIRKHFPEVFKLRCEQSRRIGCRLTKHNGERIFLDELPQDADDGREENLSCGPQCGMPKQ